MIIEELGPSEVAKVGTITLLLETSGRTTDEIVQCYIERQQQNKIRLFRIWIKINNIIIRIFLTL